MTQFQILIGCVCGFGVGLLIVLFIVGLQAVDCLQQILRHLDAQGPELMKQTRWLQIATAHAFMQRNYLQKLCIRSGINVFEKEEYNVAEPEEERPVA